jgi:uncharacterized membrane protein YhaH (DUF805 family)
MTLKDFYLTAQGRANRRQFWLWLVVPATVISLVLLLIDTFLGTYNPKTGIGLLDGIFTVVAIIPAILVYIKRLHDRDKSGWWLLVGLIPVIGPIYLLIQMGFLKGTEGPNRFGMPVPGDTTLAFRFA